MEVKGLQFDYQMRIHYSEPIHRCHFTLKCFPMQDARQSVIDCKTELLPQASFAEGADSFGNPLIFGSIKEAGSCFSVHVTGEIALLQTEYEAADAEEPFLYRNPHGMNRAGSRIRAYFATICNTLPDGAFARAVAIMHTLHRDFSYEKGCTDTNTPAEAAFAQGKGVCQDYTHIYIALCHLAGIPARYVTGLLVGEGESHAWVEVLVQEKWIGLDVTNDVPVTDSHIKFGHGRDAADCRLNTGIFYGTAQQTQSTVAVVRLLEQ